MEKEKQTFILNFRPLSGLRDVTKYFIVSGKLNIAVSVEDGTFHGALSFQSVFEINIKAFRGVKHYSQPGSHSGSFTSIKQT